MMPVITSDTNCACSNIRNTKFQPESRIAASVGTHKATKRQKLVETGRNFYHLGLLLASQTYMVEFPMA